MKTRPRFETGGVSGADETPAGLFRFETNQGLTPKIIFLSL
jgi:hypothetical protein